MDKRLKSLMIDAIVDKAVDQNPLVDRIKQFLAEADENAFLYLGGFVTLPEIGSTFVSRISGEDVEYVVASIDYHNALVETTYHTDESLYFKTTEDATNFATTGNKGTFDNWDRSKSEHYPFGATGRVTKRKTFSFSDF